MSGDIELAPRGESLRTHNDNDAPIPIPAEEGLGAGGVILLVLLSPLLLVLVILLGLLWLFLLPFRSCTHRHGRSSRSKPTALGAGGSEESGEWIQSRSGLWLHHRRWMPAADIPVRGVVFLAHGFGEHTGRAGYAELARWLTDAGFALLALDHQGHGKSTGERAYFERIDEVVGDYLDAAGRSIKREDGSEIGPEVPRFAFGHSMGGLIALSGVVRSLAPDYRAQHPSFLPFRGVLLSAPCLAIDPKLATPPLKLAAKVLSQLTPMLVLSALPASFLSRNAEAVKAYEADPAIWHGGARARVGAEMLREIALLVPQLHKVHMPVFICHGMDDAIVPPFASQIAYDGVSSEDKTFVKYAGWKHEPFEDEEKERFFRDITSWLQRRSEEAPKQALSPAAAPGSTPEATTTDLEISVSPLPQFHADSEDTN